jgi:hypothetical protein
MNNPSRKQDFMRRLLPLAAIILTVAGCGGKDSPTSPSPQTTTLNFSPTVSGNGYALQDITVFQFPGQLTATLRWTDSRKDLDLYWTNSLCVIANGDFAGTGCQVLASSTSNSGVLETVGGPVAAGSTARMFIVNFSEASEAATLNVVLQP